MRDTPRPDTERLESECARVEQRRKASYCRHHARTDAEGASDRSDDACAGATREAGRHHIENAGARCRDNNERRQQELDAHASHSWDRGIVSSDAFQCLRSLFLLRPLLSVTEGQSIRRTWRAPIFARLSGWTCVAEVARSRPSDLALRSARPEFV